MVSSLRRASSRSGPTPGPEVFTLHHGGLCFLHACPMLLPTHRPLQIPENKERGEGGCAFSESLGRKLFGGHKRASTWGTHPSSSPPPPPGRLAVTAWWQPCARGQVSQGLPLIQTHWTHKESSALLAAAFGTRRSPHLLASASPLLLPSAGTRFRQIRPSQIRSLHEPRSPPLSKLSRPLHLEYCPFQNPISSARPHLFQKSFLMVHKSVLSKSLCLCLSVCVSLCLSPSSLPHTFLPLSLSLSRDYS